MSCFGHVLEGIAKLNEKTREKDSEKTPGEVA